MDIVLLVARLVHVVLGIFWGGALIFTAVFLLPSVRDAGPDGGKVVAGLMRRRFLDVIPVVAILTVLSGFWLYWRVSLGFSHEYMKSPPAMAYGLGGAAALVALSLGLGVVRPSILRAAALAQAATAGPAAERQAGMAAADELRARAGRASRYVAGLLAVAAACMAVGRYL
jgi:hypothetical protein